MVLKVPKVFKGLQERKAFRARLASLGRRVYKVSRALKVARVIPVT